MKSTRYFATALGHLSPELSTENVSYVNLRLGSKQGEGEVYCGMVFFGEITRLTGETIV